MKCFYFSFFPKSWAIKNNAPKKSNEIINDSRVASIKNNTTIIAVKKAMVNQLVKGKPGIAKAFPAGACFRYLI